MKNSKPATPAASDKLLRDNLRALAVSDSDNRALPPATERPPIPAARGVATYTAPPVSSGGCGGIASPLTEASFSTREYYSTGTRSSDGLFFIPAIKQLSLTDANGEPVIVKLAEQVVAS